MKKKRGIYMYMNPSSSFQKKNPSSSCRKTCICRSVAFPVHENVNIPGKMHKQSATKQLISRPIYQ